jgi:hypothetical protein
MTDDTSEEPEDDTESQNHDSDFHEWCRDTNNDPNDPGSREGYMEHIQEVEAETGQKFWDGLSPEDREGYESMMTDD